MSNPPELPFCDPLRPGRTHEDAFTGSDNAEVAGSIPASPTVPLAGPADARRVITESVPSNAGGLGRAITVAGPRGNGSPAGPTASPDENSR
jgi:hypothetical protein